MIKISDLTRLIKAIKKADNSKSVSKTLDILINDESDKKISELDDAGAITGSEFVPIVQNGVTVKTTASEFSGGGSLQSAFNGGNTISMDGTHASGIDITRAGGGPDNALTVTDDLTRTGLDINCKNGIIETNYDIQSIRNAAVTLPPWGDFGSASIFKYGAAKRSLRVGTSTGTELNESNIGNSTYAFGTDNIASGFSQFTFGSNNSIDLGSPDSFSMGQSNIITNSQNSFALGKNNTLSSSISSSNNYCIGNLNELSGNSTGDITVVGNNITLNGDSSTNLIAIGNNYTVSDSVNSVFIYYDGHFGGNPTFSPSSNSFLVSVGSEISLQSESLSIVRADYVRFTSILSVLSGPGEYTPNINFKVLVQGSVTKGTLLTPTASPGQVRAVSSVDPINTPIVGVAADDSDGISVHITGCELIPLKCATGQNFTARDLVERSSSESGAVQIAAGPGPGVIAVSAMDFDGTASGGIFYGWKINNFCAS